jgi:hypothetical protein
LSRLIEKMLRRGLAELRACDDVLTERFIGRFEAEG